MKRPRLAAVIVAAIALNAAACSIKRTVTVQVPGRILRAKTATFPELVALVQSYTDKIQSLASSTMRLTFRSGKIESGKLQEYRSAPGYVLLRRPDSIRLSIQNPITKTSIADLVSLGDNFEVWSPTENKFYTGKNSLKEFEVEGNPKSPSITLRPLHIFHAILPPRLPLGEQGFRVAMEEDQEATAKYYVLSVYKEEGVDRLIPVRKYWIERAELAISRQQTYEDNGELTSIIRYSNLSPADGLTLPLSIHLDRPLDGYSLDLEFKSWKVNPQLPEDAFVLTPPAGAERIELKEKGSSALQMTNDE